MQDHERSKESFFKCLRSLAERVTNGNKDLRRQQEEGTECLQHLDNVRSVLSDVRTLKAKLEEACDSTRQGNAILQGIVAAQNLCKQHLVVLDEQTALLGQYGYAPPVQSTDRSVTEPQDDSSFSQSGASSPPSLDNTLVAGPEEMTGEVADSSRSFLSNDLPSLAECGISAQTLARMRHRDTAARTAVGDVLATPQHQSEDVPRIHSVQASGRAIHHENEVVATPLVQHHQPAMNLLSSQVRVSSNSMAEDCYGDGDTTMTALMPRSMPVNRTFTVGPGVNVPGSALATPLAHHSVSSTHQTSLLQGVQPANGSYEHTSMSTSGHSSMSAPTHVDSFATPATAHRLHSRMTLQSQWPADQLAGLPDTTVSTAASHFPLGLPDATMLHPSTIVGHLPPQQFYAEASQAAVTATPLGGHLQLRDPSITPMLFGEATPLQKQLPSMPNTPAVGNQSLIGEPLPDTLPSPPQLMSRTVLTSAAKTIRTSAVPSADENTSSNGVLDTSVSVDMPVRQPVVNMSGSVKLLPPITDEEFRVMPEYIRYQLSLVLVNQAVDFLNQIGSTSRGDLQPGHVIQSELKQLPDIGEKAGSVCLFLLKANRLRVVKRYANETQYTFT